MEREEIEFLEKTMLSSFAIALAILMGPEFLEKLLILPIISLAIVVPALIFELASREDNDTEHYYDKKDGESDNKDDLDKKEDSDDS